MADIPDQDPNSNPAALYKTALEPFKLRRGKTADIYEIDKERLLIVRTDRISTDDRVLPTPVAGKGAIITAMSDFWSRRFKSEIPSHVITTDVNEYPSELVRHRSVLEYRSMLVERVDVFPIECVVRGFLVGSGWKDYQGTGQVCGHLLPKGMVEAQQIDSPIFTPAKKNDEGHDENISYRQMVELVGGENTEFLSKISVRLYEDARDYARKRNIIIADTKFEFGRRQDGTIILIDEVLTPDSSRFWPLDEYQPGRPQRSFDKQFARDYVTKSGWGPLPSEITEATTARYVEAFRTLAEMSLGQYWRNAHRFD